MHSKIYYCSHHSTTFCLLFAVFEVYVAPTFWAYHGSAEYLLIVKQNLGIGNDDILLWHWIKMRDHLFHLKIRPKNSAKSRLHLLPSLTYTNGHQRFPQASGIHCRLRHDEKTYRLAGRKRALAGSREPRCAIYYRHQNQHQTPEGFSQ